MIVHRYAREGEYQSVAAYAEDEIVTPLAAPDARLSVRAVLPG